MPESHSQSPGHMPHAGSHPSAAGNPSVELHASTGNLEDIETVATPGAPDAASATPSSSNSVSDVSTTSSSSSSSPTAGSTHSTATNAKKGRESGSTQQQHVLKVAATALAAVALTWLWRTLASRGSSKSSRTSGGTGSTANKTSSSTRGRHKQQHRKQQQQQNQQQAAAAAAAAEQEQEEAEQPEPESTLCVLASDFQLLSQDVPLITKPVEAFVGKTVVVAEDIAVQGARIGCGIPSLLATQPTAAAHAPLVQKLLNKGLSISGQGSTQPLNYPTLGSNLRNAAGRFRVAGGGATGAVAAVAQQQADLAVAYDWLGSVRLPAACQGVFALVCTPGVYLPGGQQQGLIAGTAEEQHQGVAAAAGAAAEGGATDRGSGSGSGSSRRGSSGGIEAAGFVVRELSLLRRVGEHLALPGVADLRGDLTQVVVAEDLFSLCEQEMEPGLLCMKRAVLQWAGPEQAGSVQLLPFLESNCRSWGRLAAAAEASPLLAATTSSGRPLPPILQAITYAAQLLYHHQLAQRYGSLAAAAAAGAGAGAGAAGAGAEAAGASAAGEAAAEGSAAAAGEAAAGGASTAAESESDAAQQQQEQQQQDLGLDPLVSAALQSGVKVQQQELDDAWQLLQEVQDLLHTAVKHDVVVVVPTIPAPPPRLDAPPAALQSWLGRCHAFAALTALAGVPSVVVPVGQAGGAVGVGSGSSRGAGGPLSVALFGHSRSDQRLLTVAERLAAYARAEFKRLQEQRQAELTAAAAAAQAAAAEEGKQPQQGGRGKQQQQVEQVDARRLAKAEKAKAAGNEAFKAGKYREAIKAYTDAAKFDPSSPVYLSNRALCYLRMFSFEAAEADCNAVLAFPNLSVPDQVKALLRRGTARIHKNELEGAAADFKQVLSLEPNNRQAREELKAMQQQQREMQEEQHKALMASRLAAAPTAPPGSSGLSSSSGNGALPPFMPQEGLGTWGTPQKPTGVFGLGGPAEGGGGGSGVGAAAGGGGGAAAADAGGLAALFGANAAGLDPETRLEALRAMMQSGGLPVVLGDEGQPVAGPRGEPVIVGPGGQQMVVGPSGGVAPFAGRRGAGSRRSRPTGTSN